jgi:hypothetical protein
MLLCVFGAHVYAADPYLTEVLPEDTDVYVVFTDMTLDYKMEQGEELGAIPREYLNGTRTALDKDFEFTLPPGKKAKGIHKFKKSLDVQAQNGQKYRLRAFTYYRYTLPATISGYKVTIPARTPLTRRRNIYALGGDIAISITAPQNYRVMLTVDAQSEVDRIPGTSGMGATLLVEPKRAPVGEYITLTVAKSNFDFSKAQFYVCLRKQGKGEAIEPFIASHDVVLKKIQPGKAKLQARIPDINESGVYFAKPVDLLVVARADGEIVEVLSQEFKVSSRFMASIFWILAFVLPWFVAAFIKERTKSKKWTWLNPIWFVSGKYGGASLSLAQILLWTVLVFSASFYVLVTSGKLLALSDQVLMLLGIAGVSSVLAKITASAKEEKGREIADIKPRDPKWLDLFQSEGRPDLGKVQMALFTTLAAVFVTGKIYGTMEFPELPPGLLTLMGISNGVYLGAKATSKTNFEKLAEKANELQKAKEELEKCKAEATEAETRQQEAKLEESKANKTRDNTKDELDEESAPGKKVKLNELLEQQKKTAQEAKNLFEKADKKKKEADYAKNAADTKVRDLETAVKKLKKKVDPKVDPTVETENHTS